MGLSSSQARLLSLTGRMHQIEYSAQKIEAQKLQLANETRRVYEDYLNSLEMYKIQNKILNTDGSVSFHDTTFNNFIGTKYDANSIYILKDPETDKIYASPKIISAYENSNRTVDGFLKTLNSLNEDKSSYTSITSAEQLMQLSNSTGSFKLDADLELENWEGITAFRGTFDGNGHKITIKSGKDGLFKTAIGANIKNVELDVCIVNYEYNMVGGLVGGTADSVIENCSVKGTLNGNRWLGGAIGYIERDATISNCYADVDVSSDFISTENGLTAESEWDAVSYSGGFIGKISGQNITVTDCIAKGDMSTEYSTVGGFIGSVNGRLTATNCIAEGNITDDRSGLLKYFDGTRIYRSSFTSGTFISQNLDAAVTNLTNCIATGTFTGEESDILFHTDFGRNYGAGTKNLTNSYSTFANDEIPLINNFASVSDIDTSKYPNISDDINKYVQLFNMLYAADGGIKVDDKYLNDSNWFTNIVANGFGIIATVDINDGRKIIDTSVAVDTNLQEVLDNSKIRKAEAKYEADMRRIDMKERKYDYDLAAVENERNAIKQEIETLKTVSKENVERTFKLFS